MDQLLSLLDKNARLSVAQLATMLSRTEAEVAAQIEDYQKRGIIRGYKTIIDWEQTDRDYVIARIGIKVIPQKAAGFEEIAAEICQFEEVETAYLVSGGNCDIELTVSGKDFKDVAMFVAYRLAPLDAVQSTATSFVLRKYKERGIMVMSEKPDERGLASL